MKFKKPIVFFDLETTGVDTMLDKVVQIAVIKLFTDGTKEEKNYLVNPERPIPQEASEVHGITDKMVKDKPTFSQYAKSLYEYFEGCDIGGYNSNSFDVQMLVQEMQRAGIEFDLTGRNFIDVMLIERQLNPNTLSAVYERYTGKSLDDAHDALADVRGTIEVLECQLKNNSLEEDAEALDKFAQGDTPRVDLAGKLCNVDGKICWNFGKHKGQPIKETLSYVSWFLKQSVPAETRKIIMNEINN